MVTGDLVPADRASEHRPGLYQMPPAPQEHGLAAQGQASPGVWLPVASKMKPGPAWHARGYKVGFCTTEGICMLPMCNVWLVQRP